jgi:hypothetical protein
MRRTILAFALACLLPLSAAAAAEEPFASSAHGEAIHLVVSTQAQQLQRLDADAAADELVPRTWSVYRPATGGLDTDNTFTVDFAIGGRLVASWYVNTGEGTVEPRPIAADGVTP